MSRMHSGGKGSSGSSKPGVSEAPGWSASDKNDEEELIVSLARAGRSPAPGRHRVPAGCEPWCPLHGGHHEGVGGQPGPGRSGRR